MKYAFIKATYEHDGSIAVYARDESGTKVSIRVV